MLYLELFHGCKTPDEQPDDWGELKIAAGSIS